MSTSMAVIIYNDVTVKLYTVLEANILQRKCCRTSHQRNNKPTSEKEQNVTFETVLSAQLLLTQSRHKL